MKQVKLLIVDDETVVIKSCQKIFGPHDYKLDFAYSAEEALEKVNDHEYDIIITDLKMPGMGGMELLRTLRKEFPQITVIIFTGYANVSTAREALKCGAFDYVPKPFTPEELRDVVLNAIETRKEDGNGQMLDLMAIVSHELKSPVSAVYTTATTLHKGYFGKLDESQQRTVETIMRNCEYLEDIIRSYIDLSKMEIDDLQSFLENINFYESVVKEIVEIPEIQNNMKSMSIVEHFDKSINICGDPRLLKIVINNLVNNAIKYGKESSEIQMKLHKQNSVAYFSIYNQGVGISEEHQDKLFKKFSRLKQKGTEGVKGSGLGLYICKKIIEKHKGSIWCTSTPGVDVTFIVSLPLE